MTLESTATQAKWLESKIELAHSRQQAITAAFLTRYGSKAGRALTHLPVPRSHSRSPADRIAIAETREAALIAAFIRDYGSDARTLAGEAAQRHGLETGRCASKVIHSTGAAAESIYGALRYFLIDSGSGPEPVITVNRPEEFCWTRIVRPNHEHWGDDTTHYLYLVQIEGHWVSGFVRGYCYSASHERTLFMNVGPASYCDTITVNNPTL